LDSLPGEPSAIRLTWPSTAGNAGRNGDMDKSLESQKNGMRLSSTHPQGEPEMFTHFSRALCLTKKYPLSEILFFFPAHQD
jgi:hypothetical protein